MRVAFEDLFLPLPLHLLREKAELQRHKRTQDEGRGRKQEHPSSPVLAPHSAAEARKALFSLLWDLLDEPSSTKIESNSSDGGDAGRHRRGGGIGVCSVRTFASLRGGDSGAMRDRREAGRASEGEEGADSTEEPFQRFSRELHERLGSFLVEERTGAQMQDGEEEGGEFEGSRGRADFAIFLPPRHHLLLRFELFSPLSLRSGTAGPGVVCSIRTDRWQVLKHIDPYFDGWGLG